MVDRLLAKETTSFTIKCEGETGWFGIGLIDKEFVAEESFDIKQFEHKKQVFYALSQDGNPWVLEEEKE